MKSKQVIVIRTDLKNKNGHKVRTGKLISQGAHASMKVILDMMVGISDFKYKASGGFSGEIINHLRLEGGTAIDDWLKGLFTKICVSVDSEEELVSIYDKAKEMGIPCSMIIDAGLTEFDGVPTKTAVAIGPDWDDRINEITGHLKLL